MKSTLLVLLPPDSRDPEAALRAALEPHRLDEDDEASIRGHHWDYWSHEGDELVFQRADQRPADCTVSAILTPDGVWHDLQDHGWRMLREPSRENEAAMARWKVLHDTLLQRFADHVAVEVIVHS